MATKQESIERIPGFIYLDMDRVKSISARIDEGYIQNRVEEKEGSEKVAVSVYSNIKANILGSIGPGLETGSEVAGESASAHRSQESKALHHYYYNLLEEWLESAEGKWFYDVDSLKDKANHESELPGEVRDTIVEGDLIRVTGAIKFSDYRTSMDLMEGFFEAIDPLEDFQTNLIKQHGAISQQDFANEFEELQALQEFRHFEPLFTAFGEIIPEEYRDMVAAELSPISTDHDFKFRATINRDNLETNPVELLAKYQRSEIKGCTMLGRVENITQQKSVKQAAEEGVNEDDFNLGELLDVADELGAEFGLKTSYPQISITPIAIYR